MEVWSCEACFPLRQLSSEYNFYALYALTCLAYMSMIEILVGYEAVAKQSAYPQNTIYNAKRFIGKR